VQSSITDNSFKKSVQFGFKVQNDGDEYVKQGDLNIYNYAPVIISTSKQPANVTLPVNNNIQQIVQEINVDELYQGSIMGYIV
jgi:hypothetical protein